MRADPILLEVIRNSLQAAADEMSVALARSAYSTNIKTRLDFSCAFFDKDMKLIVQAFNQPVHLGLLVFSVPAAVESYGADNLQPGDGILINDSHKGMSHLNDICLISPLYYNNELFGYSANLAHHVDVGGNAPGSISVTTEIYQDGIIIPGVKVLKNGEVDNDLYELLRANVRGKKEFGGDLRAQIAANKLGQRRIKELINRFGIEATTIMIQEIYDYTERRTRDAIGGWPNGEFSGESYVDDDGLDDKPIKVHSKVTISDDGIVADLSNSDKQCKGMMNSTYPQSYSSVMYPIKTLLPQDIPVNDGFYRAVDIIAPKGLVVNCSYPSAVVGGWEVGLKTVEATFGALAKAMPDRVAAEGKKTQLHIAFGGVNPQTHEPYVFLETLAGGYGGRPTKDGPDAVQAHYQNTENSPVEELEIGYPVIIRKYALLPDSDGPGRFRGGLGLRRDYQFRNHEPTVTILADTAKIPPKGLLGGMEGRTARFILNPESDHPVPLKSKTTFTPGPDDILSMQTPGGGGYGHLKERDAELVLDDVRQGKISLAKAHGVYGVRVDLKKGATTKAAIEHPPRHLLGSK